MTQFASNKLVAAFCLDLIAGDPHNMPHPVRWMGRGITIGERYLAPGRGHNVADAVRGAMLTGAIVFASYSGASLGIELARRLAPRVAHAVEVILAWTALATCSLIAEASSVLDALEARDICEARHRLSMIVGRDTEKLDESEIARAVIETVAEGLCDGVVAPITYLAFGGVPLSCAYKAVNTLDSMIGHPEPPYRYFGRPAARLDDLANFIPARITAVLIIAAALFTRKDARMAWRTWLADGCKHPSPNAGQSESAMAGALRVRLGGMNFYQGKASFKPYLGANGRTATIADAWASLKVAYTVSFLAFALAFSWCKWKVRR